MLKNSVDAVDRENIERIAQNVGKNIRYFRRLQDISQADLSAAIGVSHTCLWEWETSRRLPTVQNLMAVSEALDMNIPTLIYGEYYKRNRGTKQSN